MGLADAVADGINVAEDLLDQGIVLGTDVAAQGNGISDDIGVLAAVYVGDGEYSGICGGLLFWFKAEARRQATGTGFFALWGALPCPPLPWIVTS